MKYLVRDKIFAIGDDYWIEDEQGRQAFLVDGKALRLRDTLELKDPQGRVLVTTMVGLAQGLGLKALAEGIETEAQLEFLRTAGCPLGQGYLWSGALPATELEARSLGRRAA